MNATYPDFPLLVAVLQELAILGVAGMFARTLRRRPDLERIPLRVALVLSLCAVGVLALGWSTSATPAVSPTIARVLVAQTPPVMQAILERERSSDTVQRLGLLWGVVSLVLFARLAGQGVRALRTARRAMPIPDLPLGDAPLPQPVPTIRLSSAIAAPATIGNVIVLPRSWRTLHPNALRALLQHERGHVHRQDFWWSLLSKLHVTLFWWNPLAWWVDRRLAYLAECLSDDDVLRTGFSRTDYAELLLRYLRDVTPVSVGLSAAQCMHQRLDRILDGGALTPSVGASRSTMAALLVTAAVALSLPVFWSFGAVTEFGEPLRFVLVRGRGQDVLMSGTREDMRKALAAAGSTKGPVLWYARGSQARLVKDACVITEVESFHRDQPRTSLASGATSRDVLATGPERRTFWLIRKIDRL